MFRAARWTAQRRYNRPGLRLACAEPGDQLAIFGEALRELSRARDLPLRGSRPLLVLDTTDAEPGSPMIARRPTPITKWMPRSRMFSSRMPSKGQLRPRVRRARRSDRDRRGQSPVARDPWSVRPPHSGKGVQQSRGDRRDDDALTRCRASQRRFRNTLLFVAADEAHLRRPAR